MMAPKGECCCSHEDNENKTHQSTTTKYQRKATKQWHMASHQQQGAMAMALE
jgi:hypothetical protein